MDDSKLFLYKNTMLVELMEDTSIFFRVLQYDPKHFDFYYGGIETIDFEDWSRLVLMPLNMNILSHYIRVK